MYKFVSFFSGGNVEQIASLCQCGVLQPMCSLLEVKDAKTVLVILDGLANILAAAEKMNELDKVTLHIEECGGLDRIESLQSHDNVEIYHKALAILEQYFTTEVCVILYFVVRSIFSMINTKHCSHSELALMILV
jgi:importin subunit alpha-1/8